MDANNHLPKNPRATLGGKVFRSASGAPIRIPDLPPLPQLFGVTTSAIPARRAQDSVVLPKRRKIEDSQELPSDYSAINQKYPEWPSTQLPPTSKGTAPPTPPDESFLAADDPQSASESTETSALPPSTNSRLDSNQVPLPASSRIESPFGICRGTVGPGSVVWEVYEVLPSVLDSYLKGKLTSPPTRQIAISDPQLRANHECAFHGDNNWHYQPNTSSSHLGYSDNRETSHGVSMGGHRFYTFQGTRTPIQGNVKHDPSPYASATKQTFCINSSQTSAMRNQEADLSRMTEAARDPRLVGRSAHKTQLSSLKRVPPHFGHGVKLEVEARRLLDFYNKLWVPGRSLFDSHPFRKEYAAMAFHIREVGDAVSGLAGLYVYDFTREKSWATYANAAFARADDRMTGLLNKANRTSNETVVLMVIIIFLSMQDIVSTERREQYYEHAPWWKGFKQCESILDEEENNRIRLHKTREVSTESRGENVQLSPLEASIRASVARNIILPECLMPLPALDDPMKGRDAMDRFRWLISDMGDETYAIHGACGLSRSLLYHFSQISLYAALWRDELIRDDPLPYFVEKLLSGLKELRQFSKEAKGRNTLEAAKKGEPIIAKVRERPEEYIIADKDEMTEVTAEAWRIAAMIYLRCRALRLPRDHESVVSDMDDLTECIRIMPTSGPVFTAQAPLFPVFLLGSLAVDPKHEETSMKWFEEVLAVRVRSSVRPLQKALLHVRSIIDERIPRDGKMPPESTLDRPPWWEEDFVPLVNESQKAMLCPT